MKNSLIKSIWVIPPIVLFFLFSCASTQQKQAESRDAEFYNSLGTASAEIGQYDKAMMYFNKALEQSMNLSNAYEIEMVIQAETRQFEISLAKRSRPFSISRHFHLDVY